MADQFVAEIRIFPFNFAPTGWAFCAGQIQSIAQNTALFSLLGVNYGGNGQSNFGLPNLIGSVPVHAGSGPGPGLSQYSTGQTGGESNHTLLASEMPTHTHQIRCDTTGGNDYGPTNVYPAPEVTGDTDYAAAANTTMNAGVLAVAGQGLPHNNLQAFLTLNYCIALQGIFPPRS
jgi:microcystin-dependent protein